MVIVIMGDVESGRNHVGRLLAEYLGWEFADVESLHCDASSRSSLTDADCTPHMKALYAAIDSLNYEWRDIIVSCSILNENNQSLHYHHPLVKFVHLKESLPDESLPLDRKADITNSRMTRHTAPEPHDRVLTVDSSQRVEQILTTVLSELILK